MTELSISLADLHRLSRSAPDLPMQQAYPLAVWIAELRLMSVAVPDDASPDTRAMVIKVIDPSPDIVDEARPEDIIPDAPAPQTSASRPAVPEPKPDQRSIFKPAARHNQPFSDEEDLRIWDMKNAGKTVADIAAELGRTHAAINHRWYKNLQNVDIAALRARLDPAPSATVPVAPRPAAVQAFQLTARQREIAAQVMKLPAVLSPSDDLFIARSVDQKLPFGAIADAIKQPIALVRSRWDKLTGINEMVPASAKSAGEPNADLVAVLVCLARAA